MNMVTFGIHQVQDLLHQAYECVAVCRNIPGNRCSRTLRYDELSGSYTFQKQDLSNWRQLESAVETLFERGLVIQCQSGGQP